MKLGYARVSTNDQKTQAQIDELTRYGCDKIFVEHASGAKSDRVELTRLIEFARSGDYHCCLEARLDLSRFCP